MTKMEMLNKKAHEMEKRILELKRELRKDEFGLGANYKQIEYDYKLTNLEYKKVMIDIEIQRLDEEWEAK